MPRVYLDHNATTPLDPRVREAMLPWLGGRHGNPSSVHAFGRQAREAVEAAREQVARLLDARTPEIVFTASGTEANNAVLLSCARRVLLGGQAREGKTNTWVRGLSSCSSSVTPSALRASFSARSGASV